MVCMGAGGREVDEAMRNEGGKREGGRGGEGERRRGGERGDEGGRETREREGEREERGRGAAPGARAPPRGDPQVRVAHGRLDRGLPGQAPGHRVHQELVVGELDLFFICVWTRGKIYFGGRG